VLRLGARDRIVLLSFVGQLLWLGGIWWPIPALVLVVAMIALIRY
jgi:hypothetical protein